MVSVSLLNSLRDSLVSSYQTHKGIVVAACAVVVFAALVGGMNLQSGFGVGIDLLFAFGVALIGIPCAALLIAALLALLRLPPRLLAGFLVGCCAFVSLLWVNEPGPLFAVLLVLVECTLGGSLFVILRGYGGRTKRVLAWSILITSLLANVGIAKLIYSNGIDEDLIQIQQKAGLPPPSNAADPSARGPYKVRSLYYGSGDSKRRPEFGASVDIRTRTANASVFLKEFDGWKATVRRSYWGFGMDKLPLNAHVFYPDAAGEFPLFLFVHGNHNMSVASDRGYDYLAELLASRGFIAVSVDENFLNSGLFHEVPKQQAVRGWLLLEHLRLWHEWAKDKNSFFFNKVDLSRIALGGHSRGGEAAATAALFNKLAFYPDDANVHFKYGYSIKAVVALAPEDGQYKPADQYRFLNDLDYLTIQGANDSDVSAFKGSRQYDHVNFSGTVNAFKSELYVYRANHGQFNTLWGRSDIAVPASWFLDVRPLISGEAQRKIAQTYISAFLEAALHDRREYDDLFRDYRSGRRWLPDTLYVNRFQDQSYRAICSFDEDADLTTATAPGVTIQASGLTVWREGKIPFRDGTRDYNGVFLGWNWQKASKPPQNAPSYSIDFPADVDSPALSLSVAATDDDAPDPQHKDAKPSDDVEENDGTTNFSIEAVSANGSAARVAVDSFMLLLPPLHVQFTKLEWLDQLLYKNSAEPAFQSIHVPLNAFALANPSFNPHHLRRIRLIFDKTPSRVIVISGVGLSE